MCKMKLEPGSPIESNWSYLLKHDAIPSYPVIRPLFSRPRAPYCIDTTWSASTATWPTTDVKVTSHLSIFIDHIPVIWVIWYWCGLVLTSVLDLCSCHFKPERLHCWFQWHSWPSCALVLARQNSWQLASERIHANLAASTFWNVFWRQCDWGLLSRWCRLGSYRSQAKKPNRW